MFFSPELFYFKKKDHYNQDYIKGKIMANCTKPHVINSILIEMIMGQALAKKVAHFRPAHLLGPSLRPNFRVKLRYFGQAK